MSEAVRQLTPVEVIRNDLQNFFKNNGIELSEETSRCFHEIFCKSLEYEQYNIDDRCKALMECNTRLKEEHGLMKTQLRVLTKYIEGNNI